MTATEIAEANDLFRTTFFTSPRHKIVLADGIAALREADEPTFMFWIESGIIGSSHPTMTLMGSMTSEILNFWGQSTTGRSTIMTKIMNTVLTPTKRQLSAGCLLSC